MPRFLWTVLDRLSCIEIVKRIINLKRLNDLELLKYFKRIVSNLSVATTSNFSKTSIFRGCLPTRALRTATASTDQWRKSRPRAGSRRSRAVRFEDTRRAPHSASSVTTPLYSCLFSHLNYFRTQ